MVCERRVVGTRAIYWPHTDLIELVWVDAANPTLLAVPRRAMVNDPLRRIVAVLTRVRCVKVDFPIVGDFGRELAAGCTDCYSGQVIPWDTLNSRAAVLTSLVAHAVHNISRIVPAVREDPVMRKAGLRVPKATRLSVPDRF